MSEQKMNDQKYSSSYEDVLAAHNLVKNDLVPTSCKHSPKFSKLLNYQVYLKNETEHFTSCYKERGALNALLKLSEEKKKLGVIAASSGNHAFALSYHAMRLKIPITVVMPIKCSRQKYDSCVKIGANVVLYGNNFGEAKDYADKLSGEKGLTDINGFDNPDVISGQGIIGLEILEQVPNVDAIVVPIGGGGLIAGIATYVKHVNPKIKIIGVQTEICNSMNVSLAKKAPTMVKITSGSTIADGLGVSLVGTNTFTIVKDKVDEMHVITEDKVSYGMLKFIENEKYIIEGASACTISYALFNKIEGAKHVVFVISGSNVDSLTLNKIIERGLVADGRIVNFQLTLCQNDRGFDNAIAILNKNGAIIRNLEMETDDSPERLFMQIANITVEINSKLDWSSIETELLKSFQMKVATHTVHPIFEV